MPKPDSGRSQRGKRLKPSSSFGMKPWSVEEAQLRFRDLLQAARSKPQEIRDGAVVYRIEEIARKKPVQEFLVQGGPLTDDDLSER
ncbi:hypothetical protein ACFWXH_04575 [Mesorhizobium sp. NPDC059054]|uniref:hypothetical protein n=1 Tax=Mesorhizobium sp. NPDC059054 TaxID=3346711 RepID=UPI0036B25479